MQNRNTVYRICIPPSALRAPSPDGGRRSNSFLEEAKLVLTNFKTSCYDFAILRKRG